MNLTACNKKIEKKEQDISEKGYLEKENTEEDQVAGKDIQKEEPKEQSKSEQPKENEKETGSTEVTQKPEEGRFKIPDFKTVDLDGNEVTSDFFAKNSLTVLTIWTTT